MLHKTILLPSTITIALLRRVNCKTTRSFRRMINLSDNHDIDITVCSQLVVVEEGGRTWNIMEMPSLFLRQTNISPSSSWNCRRRRASKRLVVFFLPCVAWKGNFFFAVKVRSCLQWFEKINRDSNDLKWTNIYILWDFDAKKSWRNWNKMLVNFFFNVWRIFFPKHQTF